MSRDWWWEEYPCGCVSDIVRLKRELVGYCPKHGGDRRHTHRCPKPERTKGEQENDTP